MISAEIIKKIKRIEIKTRQIVNTTFSGEYHSVFKGQGINFAEVREYQLGDDVRLIDWNVTAKAGVPFIKVFHEERELNVVVMVDISASGFFGSTQMSKRELAAEVAAVLGFSASSNSDRVGLILFTDEIETFVPSKKGKSHIMRILRDIFYFQGKRKGTSIGRALDFMMSVTKRKSIVFLISDFHDTGYETSLKLASRRHDVVPIVLEDPRELALPDAGILQLEDEETGEIMVLNSGSRSMRQRYQAAMHARRQARDRFLKSLSLMPILIQLGQPYVGPLRRYFEARGARR